MNWKPIETAPKNGIRILLCCKTMPKVVIGEWVSPYRMWMVDGNLFREPLHWQLLPEPPKEERVE